MRHDVESISGGRHKLICNAEHLGNNLGGNVENFGEVQRQPCRNSAAFRQNRKHFPHAENTFGLGIFLREESLFAAVRARAEIPVSFWSVMHNQHQFVGYTERLETPICQSPHMPVLAPNISIAIHHAMRFRAAIQACFRQCREITKTKMFSTPGKILVL